MTLTSLIRQLLPKFSGFSLYSFPTFDIHLHKCDVYLPHRHNKKEPSFLKLLLKRKTLLSLMSISDLPITSLFPNIPHYLIRVCSKFVVKPKFWSYFMSVERSFLVQLCTSWNVVINHKKMKLFFSFFIMNC